MNPFLEKVEKKILNFLTHISFLLLIFIGMVIVYLLFRESYHLISLSISPNNDEQYYDILEGILSFFIFFEFLTLIIMSIKNKGHVSMTFLVSLGVTSLVRVLLTYHESLQGVLYISVAILILIIGVAILRKYVVRREGDDMEIM
ncbi:phosphate-starvation-inducible protein PsiE [Lactococcus termiticola]|uniref:Protein PsiE n=1 Tax=Lactococcus termiticola TaxID=2169526 RepID=A0A2R5HFN8_9LACT|nr:phosphate-starvation-inducible protein PsiE [Lactococcus termiticola]GBG96145.1 phosphate-starvation-inducible protein PsiE [Lactococcus termiticola]